LKQKEEKKMKKKNVKLRFVTLIRRIFKPLFKNRRKKKSVNSNMEVREQERFPTSFAPFKGTISMRSIQIQYFCGLTLVNKKAVP